MKNKKFYVIEIDKKGERIAKERDGYEDSICFYYKKDNMWIAVDKHTGLRLAIKNKRSDLESLVHSEVFKRSVMNAITLEPQKYEELCDSYNAMKSKHE